MGATLVKCCCVQPAAITGVADACIQPLAVSNSANSMRPFVITKAVHQIAPELADLGVSVWSAGWLVTELVTIRRPSGDARLPRLPLLSRARRS